MLNSVRTALGTLLVAGMATVGFDGAMAATPAGTTGTAGPHGHSGLLAELKQAHKLMAEADHDYDGHRAKAAHEVMQAMHELAGKNKSKGTTGTGTAKTIKPAAATAKTGTGTSAKMPQAQSDALLQQALTILTKSVSQVPSGNGAGAKIQAAIAELNAALKIK